MATDTDLDTLVRTTYGEGGAEPLAGQQAIASTIVNRAVSSGAPITKIATNPSDYQAWGNPTLKAKMLALSPTDPTYQAISDAVQPVLNGSVALPYVNYLNRDTTPPGSSALTGWAANPGVKIGSQEYYTPQMIKGGYSPELSNAMGESSPTTSTAPTYTDPALANAMGETTGPDTGITSAGTHKTTGTDAQQQTLRRYQATGDLTTDPNTNQPFFKGTPIYSPASDEEVKGVPVGSYYVAPDKAGTLRFNGPKTDDLLGSIGQGIDDIAQNFGNILPGGQNSDLHNRLQVLQDQYNATKAGTPVNDTGRFLGQFVPTTAALGGVGAIGDAVAGAVPSAAPALEFLGGSGGGTSLLSRVPSLAANGAIQGGVANALMNPDQTQSPLSKFQSGAEFGAVVNPAVAGLGSAVTNAFLPKTSNFVNGLAQDLDKFGLLQGPGSVRATQLQGADTNLTFNRVPVTPAEKAASQDQNLINTGAFGYRENATAQPLRMMQAVGSTFGLTPDQMPNGFASNVQMPDGSTNNVMALARNNIGNTINNIRSSQVVSGGDLKQLFTDLSQEVINAKDAGANPDGINQLRNVITNLKSTTRMTGKLTGDQYQNLINYGSDFSDLQSSSDPKIARSAQAMRSVAENAMNSSSSADTVAQLKQAQLQYKNMKTVEPLVNKNPSGIFPMSDLQGAVNSNFDYRPTASKSPLETLSDIGQRLPNLDTGPYKTPGAITSKFGHTALGTAIGELGLFGLGSLNMGSAAGVGLAGAGVGLLAGRKVANTVGGALANNQFLRNKLLSNTGYTPNSLTQFLTNNAPVPALTAASHLGIPKTVQQNTNTVLNNFNQQQQGSK